MPNRPSPRWNSAYLRGKIPCHLPKPLSAGPPETAGGPVFAFFLAPSGENLAKLRKIWYINQVVKRSYSAFAPD